MYSLPPYFAACYSILSPSQRRGRWQSMYHFPIELSNNGYWPPSSLLLFYLIPFLLFPLSPPPLDCCCLPPPPSFLPPRSSLLLYYAFPLLSSPLLSVDEERGYLTCVS